MINKYEIIVWLPIIFGFIIWILFVTNFNLYEISKVFIFILIGVLIGLFYYLWLKYWIEKSFEAKYKNEKTKNVRLNVTLTNDFY